MQKPTHKTQVVIVGAGPTGLSLAIQLLRYNIEFILIEKNEKTTPFSKAIVIHARSLEIFREIDLTEKAIKEGRITTALNVFYKGKRKASVDIAGLGVGLSAFPFALSLEQSKTEKLLVDYLSEKGKTICWNSAFLRSEQNETGVTVYYKDRDGQEQTIEAEYLVGCDGAHSPVRHQAGLSFEGDTMPKMFYIADVTLNSPVVNKDQLYGFLINKGFVLFFPMEGIGHYRVIGILPDKTGENDTFTFEDIEGTIKEHIVSPVEFKEVRWFSTYKVHSRKADSFMKDRYFIAGDAAHIHTPAGGQGMNTGIQDAYNLAWKLAYAIHGDVNPSVLESYNTERMENAKHLLQTTDKMFDIFAGTNPFWNFIRLQVFPLVAGFVSKNQLVNKQIFPLLSQIGIAYPDSPLTDKSNIGNVRAGDRMPYFVFRDGKNIFDHLTEPCFKILFFGADGNNPFEELKDPGFKITTFSFNEIPEPIFGTSADFYILLRPDNHISYIGKDMNGCNLLLEKISRK